MKLSLDQEEIVQRRIRAAKEAHRDAYKIPDTLADANLFANMHERNLALIGRDYWDKADPGVPYKHIGQILPIIEAKHVVVCGGETQFVIHGTSERFNNVADEARGLINHAWKTLNFDSVCEDAQFDTYAHRFGVVELGWKYETADAIMYGDREESEAPSDATEEEPANPPQTLPAAGIPGLQAPGMTVPGQSMPNYPDMSAMPQQPAVPGQPPIPPEQQFPQHPAEEDAPKQPDDEVLYDDPFIERFSPMDFFVDPACTSYKLTDARYAFRRKTEIVGKVKKNKAYTNNKELKGMLKSTYDQYRTSYDDMRNTADSANLDDDFRIVELWDGYMYLDRGRGEEFLHILWCEENKRPLLVEPAPYKYFRKTGNPFPFRVVPCTVINKDDFYGLLGDVEAVADLQIEFDQSYTVTAYQRAHSPAMLQVPTDMDEEERKRVEQVLKSGIENALLPVSAQYIGKLAWLAYPSPHTDSYQTQANTRKLIEEQIGISQYQANEVPSGAKRTKAEVQAIQSQGQTRQDWKINLYHDFIKDVATCVLVLFQQFIEREKEYCDKDATGHERYGSITLQELRTGRPDEAGTATVKPIDFDHLPEPGLQFAITIDPAKKRPPSPQDDLANALDLLKEITPYLNTPDPDRIGQPLMHIRPLLEAIIAKSQIANGDEVISKPIAPGTQEEKSALEVMKQHYEGILQKIAQNPQALQQAGQAKPHQHHVGAHHGGQGMPPPGGMPGM